ncbi:hypothetical protein [Neorhizobium sp. T25_27]|uniref:hypothetical protein n=1 Tax=Neorhizobium sp. T25_27 TaxID=2093831 RepID=UPI000CF85768|nr:hypothetical protein [Neorhizobium sp. T25_27]
MSGDYPLFPHAMNTHDLRAMRDAVRRALELSEETDGAKKEQLAKIVYRFYRRGLADPEKLAGMAVFLSSSRTFRRETSHTDVEAKIAAGNPSLS